MIGPLFETIVVSEWIKAFFIGEKDLNYTFGGPKVMGR